MNTLLLQRGILMETTAPHTQEQNGATERLNQTLMRKCRALLYHSNLSNEWWGHAVHTAVYLYNRTIHSNHSHQSPFEVLKGKPPSLNHLKVFGCKVVFKDFRYLCKLQPRGRHGIFVGYSLTNDCYLIYILDTRQLIETRDVHFFESSFPHPLSDKDSLVIEEEEEDIDKICNHQHMDYNTDINNQLSQNSSELPPNSTDVNEILQPNTQHNSLESTNGVNSNQNNTNSNNQDSLIINTTSESIPSSILNSENTSQSIPFLRRSQRLIERAQREDVKYANYYNTNELHTEPKTYEDAMNTKSCVEKRDQRRCSFS